jgi:hypothetical protein
MGINCARVMSNHVLEIKLNTLQGYSDTGGTYVTAEGWKKKSN